jgi:hypothetical protein
MSATEIHRELCAVHSQNVISEQTVRQCCRMFKDGSKNFHDEQRSGQPSAVSDDLVQSVDQKFVKDGASHFQNFHVNLHTFHTLFSRRLS